MLTALGRDGSFDNSHPFWNIRRSSCFFECNCDMVEVAITSLICSDMKEVTTEGSEAYFAMTDLDVVVPCIRNTEKIAAGQELVLRWEKKDGKNEVRRFPRLFGRKRVINALSEQAPSAKKGRM